MLNLFDWFKSGWNDRSWLILGKGPTFAKRVDFDLTRYHLLGLNHVCREQPVLLAHLIDLDVIDDLDEVLERNAQFLAMPWVPHVRNEGSRLSRLRYGPTILSRRSLDVLARGHPILRRLDEQGRLLWYNLSTAPPHGSSPIVRVRYFSAEAALHLLATAGVQTIRSLGIDGGASYSLDFEDLKDKTLLANTRSSFDGQFAEFARIIMETGTDYAPLDVESPVRVYVAAMEAQMLSVKILEWSIRKHASLRVEVCPMHPADVAIPIPKDPANRPRTPFSFQRFLIPALAGYRGRAIYLDSDMQVFKDIRHLWRLPFGEADVLTAREPEQTGRKPQFSVMLLNCERLRWDIGEIVAAMDRGELTYESLMYEMAVARQVRAVIDASWNSLERYEEGTTALVHYTDMTTQPWVATDNPLNYLWVRDLLDAIDNGFVSLAYIRDHVANGYVRPSLLYQAEHRLEDSLILPKKARDLDRDFRAPFTAIHSHGASAWRRPTHAVRAVARHWYHKSALARFERRLRNRLST